MDIRYFVIYNPFGNIVKKIVISYNKAEKGRVRSFWSVASYYYNLRKLWLNIQKSCSGAYLLYHHHECMNIAQKLLMKNYYHFKNLELLQLESKSVIHKLQCSEKSSGQVWAVCKRCRNIIKNCMKNMGWNMLIHPKRVNTFCMQYPVKPLLLPCFTKILLIVVLY